MIKAIISDFSSTLLFIKSDNKDKKLNQLYVELPKEDFNFFDYFYLNEELHNFYKQISNKIPVYIFTTGRIQEDEALMPYIQGTYSKIFTVMDINNITKDMPEAYEKLSELINVPPEEIVFIDDTLDNISAASKAGLQTILYKDFDQFQDDYRLLKLTT